MQKCSIAATALLAALALPVHADSINLSDGRHSITLSGENSLIVPLASAFESSGFRKSDGLPDNRPTCVIGTAHAGTSHQYETYCYDGTIYIGGMFTFASKESAALLPDILCVLIRTVEKRGSDAQIISVKKNEQAVCLPDSGCVPFSLPEQFGS